MSKKICFSYVRFSHRKQARGSSEARQIPIVERVAKEKGWTVDKSLNVFDLGISAFKRDNLSSIKAILEAVKSGKILQGSVMVIEAFDRLTRIDIDDAVPLLWEILGSGLELYIDRISRHLTKASLKQPIELTQVLFELKGSYEYSDKLSHRLDVAWGIKKKNAGNGNVLTAKTPSWVLLDGPSRDKKTSDFKIDHKKANVIRRIFKEYLEGKGPRLIALGLNQDKIPNFDQTWAKGKGWSTTPIKRFLTSVSVMGTYQPSKYITKSKKVPEGEPIEGYYPAIIDKATFYAVQRRMTERRTTRGARKHLFNLFSGLIKCKHCGSTIVLKSGAVTKIGKKEPWVTLLCSKAQRGMGCEYRTIKYKQIERGILSVIWMSVRNAYPVQDTKPDPLPELQGQLEHAKAKRDRLKKQVEDTGDAPKALIEVLSKLELEANELTRKIALLPSKSESDSLVNWKPIPNDIPNRMLLQGVLSNIIEQIILDPSGKTAEIQFRDGNESITIGWDERYKSEFLLIDGEERHPVAYVDDALVWKSDKNIPAPDEPIIDTEKILAECKHNLALRFPRVSIT